MRKIFNYIITAIILICILCSCSTKSQNFRTDLESPTVTEDREYVSFEKAVKISTNVVVAEFTEEIKDGNSYEFKFKVKKQLKGDTGEEIIFVRAINSTVAIEGKNISFNNVPLYAVGEKYLLVLERHISVYYEHDRYSSFADVIIPLGNMANAQMYRQDIRKHSLQDVFDNSASLENYVLELLKSEDNQTNEYSGYEYTTSDSAEECVKLANYVITFTPQELFNSSETNGTEVYDCTVKSLHKGELNVETVRIKFFKGTVEIGKEYTAALYGNGEERIFTLTSKHSLAVTEDEVNALLKAVNG